jgi:hypothetical protein
LHGSTSAIKRRVEAVDHASRRLEAGVQVDRGEDRLERVCEDGRAPAAPGLELALAQAQAVAELEFEREPVQSVLAHQ